MSSKTNSYKFMTPFSSVALEVRQGTYCDKESYSGEERCKVRCGACMDFEIEN